MDVQAVPRQSGLCEDAASDTQLARTMPPAAYFPARESRQSSPWGNRRRSAFTSLMRPFPPGTPFGDAACGGAIQLPAKPESSCLPVRLFGVVTAQPVQCYPPRLESRCNSLAISMPHKVSALYFSVCPSGSGRQRHACISTGNILYFVIY